MNPEPVTIETSIAEVRGLRAHQVEALNYLQDRYLGGLFYEMGLGKTLTMLQHLDFLSRRGKNPFPCLIVGPVSSMAVWAREIKKFGFDFKVQHLAGTYQERVALLQKPADVYLINYDYLRIIKEHLHKKKFRCVILDESHRIKNRGSQQSDAAYYVSRSAVFRYIMTGTPYTKNPEDLWAQMRFLKDDHLPNFYVFRARYVEFKNIKVRAQTGKKDKDGKPIGHLREIRVPSGTKRLPELEGKLSELCLRRTKKECLDLPEKIYKTIYCPITKEQLVAYRTLKTSLKAMIESEELTVKTASAVTQKLQQICQGFVYNEVKDPIYFKENAKLSMLKDYLKDLAGEKVILFTKYVAEIPMIKLALAEGEHRVLEYAGTVDEKRAIEDDFQKCDDPVIFIGNIEACKESITLTAASNVIYFGNTNRYDSRVQSEDRAHRIGQKNNVVYADFVMPNTADELVSKLLLTKAHAADAVLGDSMRLARMIAEEGD